MRQVREARENRAQTRYCNRGRFQQSATDPIGLGRRWRRLIRKSGHLLDTSLSLSKHLRDLRLETLLHRPKTQTSNFRSVIFYRPFRLLLILAFVLIFQPDRLWAGDFVVTGIVTDAISGEVLPQAQVTLLNHSGGTVTDQSGKFQLSLPQANAAVLRISYMGYTSKDLDVELNPRGNATLSIALIPENIRLPAVTVQASASPRNLSLPGGTYHRFAPTRQELRVAPETIDLLKHLPEIDVKSMGPGQSPQISLRGSQTNQVLILINGQPTNSGNTGQFDINQIPANSISEIQVAPGNQSARYGNQAMGGVVNFVLVPPKRSEQTNLSTSLGSWDQRKVSISNDLHHRNWSLNLHASMDEATNRFSYIDDFDVDENDNGSIETRNNTATRHHSFWMGATWQPRRAIQWDNQGFFNKGQQQLPGPLLELTPDAANQTEQTHFASQLLIDRQQWTITSRSVLDYSFQHQTARQTIFGGHDLTTTTSMLEQSLKIHQNTDWTGISVEGSWRRETLDSQDNLRAQNSLGEHDRQTVAVVVVGEATWKYRSLVVSPNLAARYEDFPNASAIFTNQAGLSLELEKLTTWIKFGTGYRLPDFWELFWVPDVYAVGNPLLKPEESFDREWGFRLAEFSPLHINFVTTIFQQDYAGLISWVRGYGNQFYPENLDSARIRGVSASLSCSLWPNHLTTDVTLDLKDPRNLTAGPNSYLKYLPYRPLSNFTWNTQWNLSDWYFQTSFHSQGRTYIRKANTKWLDPFSEWNSALGYQTHYRSTIITTDLSLLNVTDERYEVLERYPMPGRHWAVSIALTY